ncbi:MULTISPECIES: hypothetical protein [unclassified Streptomyces]|uniref:hypothetical protein n=1 Tax=unclassified Streptomyces TaxID=2593676 RepID=UPI002257EB12|nr:hypothetical protein [Streptomyces sp. NBC_00047]MCX5609445.1 hypothetical protein [Streptomyces sp. NBC_00047]
MIEPRRESQGAPEAPLPDRRRHYRAAVIGKWGFGPEEGDRPSHPREEMIAANEDGAKGSGGLKAPDRNRL